MKLLHLWCTMFMVFLAILWFCISVACEVVRVGFLGMFFWFIKRCTPGDLSNPFLCFFGLLIVNVLFVGCFFVVFTSRYRKRFLLIEYLRTRQYISMRLRWPVYSIHIRFLSIHLYASEYEVKKAFRQLALKVSSL